jgi:capsular polysaccharide transport system permease protein
MPSKESGQPTGAMLQDSQWLIVRRVIGALLLRELLTRYGRNNIGFLWLFVEPMLFVLVITAIWAATRSVLGSNIPIVAFALTGYSSMLLWRGMPSRCIGALKSNLPLLYHRQVTILDVYASRILLEFMAVSTSFVALGIAFYAMDWIPAPEDALKVLGGWMLLGWFGAGLGLTIGALSERYPFIGNVWSPMSYIFIVFAGVAFLADALPEEMREIVLWLPMLNGLEYLREGWFGSLFQAHYDIPYVIVFNLLLTFSGLSFARQVGLDTGDE